MGSQSRDYPTGRSGVRRVGGPAELALVEVGGRSLEDAVLDSRRGSLLDLGCMHGCRAGYGWK